MSFFSTRNYIPYGYGASDIGKVRENNEDALFIDNNSGLYIVCDGMGGHNAGEVASAKCIEEIRAYISRDFDYSSNYIELLLAAIRSANSIIYTMSCSDSSLKKMGTTVAALLIKKDKYYAAWCGDSRIYLFRKNNLKRLTKDHSKVQMLIDAGVTTEEKAWNHPERNVIFSAIGISENPEPGVLKGELNAGDLFLLCSDGIHGEIQDGDIKEILVKNKEIDEAVDALIAQSLNVGGSDNATAILVSIKGD